MAGDVEGERTPRRQSLQPEPLCNQADEFRIPPSLSPRPNGTISTFFQEGTSDGKKQNFATPGLVIGRLHLWKRVGLTIGGGYQIATTHFHTTNHNAILSIRFPF